MRGKDVLRRRGPLSRSAAAAAVVMLLCCREGMAQRTPSSVPDLIVVDTKVTIKVENGTISVDPDVFVARKEGLSGLLEVEALARRIEELARAIERRARRDDLRALAKGVRESAERMKSAGKGDETKERARTEGRASVEGPIEFVVQGLPVRHSVEIDFKAQAGWKGPFLLDRPDPTRPARGRYVFREGGPAAISSGRVDVTHFPNPSVWKYEVVLRGPDDQDLVAIDPMGVLK